MLNQKPSIFPHILSRLGVIGLLAIAYYATAEISRYLASTPQSVTPVWPPDGLAVGAVLLLGNWVWGGVFLGSFFANFLAFQDRTNWLSLAVSVLPVLGIAIGTTLGSLFGAYLLRRFVKNRYPLDQIADVFKFLILVGMVAPSVNATAGVTCLALSGKVPWSAYETVWLTWWVSNVSGIFIVTPVLISWDRLIRDRRFPVLSWGNLLPPLNQHETSADTAHQPTYTALRAWLIAEPLLLLGLVILVGQVAFGSEYHLEYMVVPILIWSAFRLGQPGATLANFVVAAIAVTSTVKGNGGFARADLNQSLILLESFIGVITLTVLILTAAIAERKAAESQLRLAFAEIAKTNETLETRVQQRTEELNEKNTVLEQTLQTLKRTQLQMIQSEKMSALGQLVAGIAHEINNPVNFIHGNLSHISEYIQSLLGILQSYQNHYPDPPQDLQMELEEIELPFLAKDLSKILHSMKLGTDRISSIVLSLRNFSRLDESEFKAVDIHEGIDSTLVILQHRLQSQTNQFEIQVIKEYGQLPLVECFAGQINQVFMNILSNAIDALEELNRNSQQEHSHQNIVAHPSIIWIHTQMRDDDQVEIAITDNGAGITEAHRSKLFDPFFTTKPVGKGTGLGLSVCYQIVTEKHGGKLWCDFTSEQGTRFVIELPVKVKSKVKSLNEIKAS